MQRLTVLGSYNFTYDILEDALLAMGEILQHLKIEYRTVKGPRKLLIPKVTQKFNVSKAKVVDAVLTVVGRQGDGGPFLYDRSDVEPNRIMITFMDPHAPKGRNFFSFVIEPNKQVRPVQEG